jgi:hypothetical protein
MASQLSIPSVKTDATMADGLTLTLTSSQAISFIGCLFSKKEDARRRQRDEPGTKSAGRDYSSE